jgi:hypothetical protein
MVTTNSLIGQNAKQIAVIIQPASLEKMRKSNDQPWKIIICKERTKE